MRALELTAFICIFQVTVGFVFPISRTQCSFPVSVWSSSDNEAERLKSEARELREQVRNLEKSITRRKQDDVSPSTETTRKSLRDKTVLVAGANGRLGSMVCRYLLRNHPSTQVVAAVHYVGENSPTSRGYGRLSYEVGAEDGVGSIGPAWSADERTASFEYDANSMDDYNLRNLRIVECEFLDPVQCRTVVEGCDSVIWCATDFNGNAPRAVASLNIAFLFRAVTRPSKGCVEVDGLRNLLSALKYEKREREQNGGMEKIRSHPTSVVHVSMVPRTFSNVETPLGSFWSIKEQSEQVVRDEFPGLSSAILQFGQFEDNFVDENLDVLFEHIENPAWIGDAFQPADLKRINRRDAARAVVDALLNDELMGKTNHVWTDTRV